MIHQNHGQPYGHLFLRLRSRSVQVVLITIAIILSLGYLVLGTDLRSDNAVKRQSSRPESHTSPKAWEGWKNTKSMFVFGDSYSATWFNVSGDQPTPARIFGNHDQWSMFSVDGINPVALPAQTRSRWPLRLAGVHNLTTTLVYNFAAGGSATDPQLRISDERDLMLVPTFPPSFRNQVLDFWRYYAPMSGETLAEWTSETTIFAVWTGVNDVQTTESEGDQLPMSALFASYIVSMERAGARTFLLLNLPPIQRITDGSGIRRKAVPQFNDGLLRMIKKLTGRFEEATVYHFDVHQLLIDALDGPWRFQQTAGLKDLRNSCPLYAMGTAEDNTQLPRCKYAVNEYFWQDSVHVTQEVDDLIAERIAMDCFSSTVMEYCSVYTKA